MSPRAALLLTAFVTTGCLSEFNITPEVDDAVGALEDTASWQGEEPEDEQPEDEEPEDEEPEDEEPEDEEPEDEEPDEDPDPPDEDDCTDTSELIYLMSRDDETLYLFDPETLARTQVAELDCTMWGETPGSMGVARDGYAYVRYSDDSLYQVDLVSGACSPTGYSDRSTRFGAFGMGYATQNADTWRDDMFVANSRSLARLDTRTWSLQELGDTPSQAELTGNADGELWAFLPLEQPAALVRLNKQNAGVVERLDLSGFPDPSQIDTFAFATWGGQFFLFVRVYGMGESTRIYRVSARGDLELLVEDTGLNVVGAGVSTCAPTD